jgi:hypothetical protein
MRAVGRHVARVCSPCYSAGDVATRPLDLTTVHLRLQEASLQDNGASASSEQEVYLATDARGSKVIQGTGTSSSKQEMALMTTKVLELLGALTALVHQHASKQLKTSRWRTVIDGGQLQILFLMRGGVWKDNKEERDAGFWSGFYDCEQVRWFVVAECLGTTSKSTA